MTLARYCIGSSCARGFAGFGCSSLRISRRTAAVSTLDIGFRVPSGLEGTTDDLTTSAVRIVLVENTLSKTAFNGIVHLPTT